MKELFLSLIKIYKRIPRRRGRCLFKESCSTYVYRVTSQEGFLAGISAMRSRFRKCKPGYCLVVENGKYMIRFADGSLAPPEATTIKILP